MSFGGLGLYLLQFTVGVFFHQSTLPSSVQRAVSLISSLAIKPCVTFASYVIRHRRSIHPLSSSFSSFVVRRVDEFCTPLSVLFRYKVCNNKGSQDECEKWCEEEAHGQIDGWGRVCLVWSKTTVRWLVLYSDLKALI